MKNLFFGLSIFILFIVIFSCENAVVAEDDNPPVVSAYDYYVNMTTGSDSTHDGKSSSNAFKTITHTISTAAVNKSIKVAPGLYNVANGETFPINLKQGQSLTGDIVNKGVGTTATEIRCTNTTASTITSSDTCMKPATKTVIKGFKFNNSVFQNFVFGIYSTADLTTDISNNTFGGNLYGGVCFESGNLKSENNVFDVFSYAYYLINTLTSTVLINNNNIGGNTAIPISLLAASNKMVISNNTITGNGFMGIQTQYGNPVIQGNTFNFTSGYNYGAITCLNGSPKIRSNIFQCAKAIDIGESGSADQNGIPDIGTAGDPGNNNFSAVTTYAIKKWKQNLVVNINAMSNIWPASHNPPTSSDIVIDNTGDRVYYSVSGYITKP